MLQSSILGQEFVNYRKNTDNEQREKFSDKVRSRGMGYVPIVIDSVDPEISLLLARKNPNYPRDIRYGLELTMHMDLKVEDIVKEVKIEMLKKDINNTLNIKLGLEDGTFPDLSLDIGTLYKAKRNQNDKILYLLVTKEQSMFGYIMSIIKYLTSKLSEFTLR
jgi:hypothetical protein